MLLFLQLLGFNLSWCCWVSRMDTTFSSSPNLKLAGVFWFWLDDRKSGGTNPLTVLPGVLLLFTPIQPACNNSLPIYRGFYGRQKWFPRKRFLSITLQSSSYNARDSIEDVTNSFRLLLSHGSLIENHLNERIMKEVLVTQLSRFSFSST